MKRIISSLVVLVSILAFASVASAQIVPPPVDNTDLARPAPKATPPTVTPVRPAPKTITQVQAPTPVQPGKSWTEYGINILVILVAIVAIGLIARWLLFRRGGRKNPKPADDRPLDDRPEAGAGIPARFQPPAPSRSSCDNFANLDSITRGPAPQPPAPAPAPVSTPLPDPGPRPSAIQPAPAPRHTPAPPAAPPANDELDLATVLGIGKKPATKAKPESKAKGGKKTAKGQVTKQVIKKAARRAAKVIIFAILTFGLANVASAQTKVLRVSPNGFYQGLLNQPVTLTGTDLANVTAVTFGNPAITATVGIATATSVDAKVSVPTTTPVGRYSVKVVNKDGSTVDTNGVLLYVFSRDSALVGSYVGDQTTSQIEALRQDLTSAFNARIEGLKKTLTADSAKIQSEVNTRLDRQDARLGTFAEAVKARLAEIAAAKKQLDEHGTSIGSLNARVSASEALATEAADDAELALGLASETAGKTVVIEASRIPFVRAKKKALSEGSTFAEAVKARLAEIAAAKKQ